MRVLAVAILGILYISLGTIYYMAPPDLVLWSLGILVLLAGAVLTVLGGQRNTYILSVLALLTSITAASLIGFTWLGATGGLIMPIIWMGLAYVLASWIWRSTIEVPGGTVLIINHPFGDRVYRGVTQIRPLLPFLERQYVHMPVYELVSQVNVEQINTRSLQNIRGITLETRYQVREPLRLLQNLPNRTRTIEELSAKFNLSPDTAVLRTAFWENLLDGQIREVIDNLVRTIVYEHVQRAVDASTERTKLAQEVYERLRTTLQRWGIEIHSLNIENVDLDPEQIRRSKREAIIKREIEDAERAAKIEAQKIAMMGKAQAEVQAHAIASWIDAIQKQGVNLSPEDIEQIVLNALEEMHDKYQRVELFTGMKKQKQERNGQQERIVNQ